MELREKIATELAAWLRANEIVDDGALRLMKGDATAFADSILALPEIKEALERSRTLPTTLDCRFGIIDKEAGGELLAQFDVPETLAAGDTITLPPFKITSA